MSDHTCIHHNDAARIRCTVCRCNKLEIENQLLRRELADLKSDTESESKWAREYFDKWSNSVRENTLILKAGKALRDALAFECHKLGDCPREIDEWDALVSALPNVQAQR